MDKQRVWNEKEALQEQYPVAFDLNSGDLRVQLKLPSGWNESEAWVWVDLPETYPQSQPEVYISDELRYHGEEPRTMLDCQRDGWARYCIHGIEWNSDRHTTNTIIRLLATSLKAPNKRRPVKQA